MPSTNKLTKHALIFTIGGVLTKLILFIFVPLFTYYLTVEETGTIDLLVNASDLLMIFLSVGITEAVFRMSMEKAANKKEVYSIGLVIMTIGHLIFLCFAPLINQISQIEGFGYYLVAMSFMAEFTDISRTFTRSLEKVGSHVIGDIIYALTFSLVSILFIMFFHMGITGYLLAFIIGHIAESVYLFVGCRLYKYLTLHFEKKGLLKKMLRYSLPMIIPATSWWIINMFNKVLIQTDPTLEMGFYSFATKVPIYLAAVYSFFAMSWSITSVGDYEDHGFDDQYTRVYQFVNIVFLVLTSLVITFIEPFIRYLADPSYYPSYVLVPLLAIALMLNCFCIFLGSVYLAAKQTIRSAISDLTGIIVAIIVGTLLIKPLGLYAVAFGTFFGILSTYLFRYFDTRKYIRIHAGWRAYVLFGGLLAQASLFFFISNPWILLAINGALTVFSLAISGDYLVKSYKSVRAQVKQMKAKN